MMDFIKAKKKQVILIAILVLAVGGMAWVWLPQLMSQTNDNAVLDALNGPASAISGHSALPLGKNFNIQVLTSDKFKELVTPYRLKIDSSDLGRDNPFLPPSASTSTPASPPK